MVRKVSYWSDVIKNAIDMEENPDVAKVVDQLMDGETQSADLELMGRFKGEEVLSARINDTHRLLVTTAREKGESFLRLLEIIRKHRYDKSKILNDKGFERFKEKNNPAYLEEVKQILAKRASELKVKGEPFQLKKVELFNEKFIELTDEQNNAVEIARLIKEYSLTQPSFTLSVSGGPGSGKSVTALAIIKQLLCQEPVVREEEKPLPILYLCHSIDLVEEMLKLLPPLLTVSDINKHHAPVEFKTCHQFLEAALNRTIGKNDLANPPFFIDWCNSYSKTQTKIARATRRFFDSTLFSKEFETVFQEFRTISGYERDENYEQDARYEQDEYVQLGERQCLFKSKEERIMLRNAYEAYQRHLVANNKIEPAFHRLDKQIRYQAIVLDEGQDLSALQLKQAFESTLNFVLLFDMHQSFYSNYFPISAYVKKLCRENGRELTKIKLPGSARCPAKILELANGIVDLKVKLTGGLSSKEGELRRIAIKDSQKENPGEVHWFTGSQGEYFNNHITPLRGKSHFAIITDLDANEVNKEFNHPQILTPEQAKGLEFDEVLLVSPFNSPLFKEANKKLEGIKEEKTQENRAKREYDPLFNTVCNKLYVDVTRAKKKLYILQEDSFHLQNILNPLKAITATWSNTNQLVAEPQENTLTTRVETLTAEEVEEKKKEEERQEEANWVKQFVHFMGRGEFDVARKIFWKLIGRKDEETFLAHRILFEYDDLYEEALVRFLQTQKNESATPLVEPEKSTPAKKQPKKLSKKQRKAKQKKAEKPSSSVEINTFLQAFNKVNLMKILNKANYIELLFNTPVEGAPHLLHALSKDHRLVNNPWVLKELKTKMTINAFHSFLTLYVKQRAKTNTPFFTGCNDFIKELLLKHGFTKLGEKKKSALLLLSQISEWVELLDETDKLLSFKGEDLLLRCPDTNKTVLYYLLTTKNKRGNDLFTEIFTRYTPENGGIQQWMMTYEPLLDSLSATMTVQHLIETDNNTPSLLELFTQTNALVRWVDCIIFDKEEFFAIPATAFFTRSNPRQAFPFTLLMKGADYFSALKNDSKKREQIWDLFRRHIPSETLFEKIEGDELSLFHVLLENQNYEALLAWVEHQGNALAVSPGLFLENLPASKEENKRLCNLLQDPFGCRVLLKLISANQLVLLPVLVWWLLSDDNLEAQENIIKNTESHSILKQLLSFPVQLKRMIKTQTVFKDKWVRWVFHGTTRSYLDIFAQASVDSFAVPALEFLLCSQDGIRCLQLVLANSKEGAVDLTEEKLFKNHLGVRIWDQFIHSKTGASDQLLQALHQLCPNLQPLIKEYLSKKQEGVLPLYYEGQDVSLSFFSKLAEVETKKSSLESQVIALPSGDKAPDASLSFFSKLFEQDVKGEAKIHGMQKVPK
ncbi:MAG: UvrD-helicase domain-containing protein [Tatlockia sp.]|jgi:hypothetical protein